MRQVLAGANVHVGAQAPLLRIEPLEGAGPRPSAPTASPSRACSRRTGFRRASAAARTCARLEWLMLGYDIDADEVEQIIADLHGECVRPARV